MTPTRRAAVVLAAVAVAALLSPALAAVLALGWLAALVLDAAFVRSAPRGRRTLPAVLSRGVGAGLQLEADPPARAGGIRLRQAGTPDLRVERGEDDGALDTRITARRRGRHRLPAAASRTEGPLGLAAWHHRLTGAGEVLVYPDLRMARRLALGVREGRFRDPGLLARGPLGLGTDFESIRDYQPDDDIRQVNWPATARAGRPMSNQYRIEQDRDVLCLLDAGRLMRAPVPAGEGAAPALTRLDAAIDAAAAVALVADELGDRCGTVAFDDEVRRRVTPRRRGGDAVVHSLFDLEASGTDSDYEMAFRLAGAGKRSLVLVFTDLLDEAAGRSLIEAIPVLARRHAVIVASARDRDLSAVLERPPESVVQAHAVTVALGVVDARARVASRLRRGGADVLEADPGRLPAACVRAYLEAKRRARV